MEIHVESAFRRITATLPVALVLTALMAIGAAQTPPAKAALPLENLGLEHLDIIVPDTAASARFYSRIFKSALHQQPVRDTLRYFILLGDLPADRQVGYVAIGAAGERMPAIGHYCTLAKVYDRAGMAAALQSAGYGVAGAGPTGMWPDPDRLELRFADGVWLSAFDEEARRRLEAHFGFGVELKRATPAGADPVAPGSVRRR